MKWFIWCTTHSAHTRLSVKIFDVSNQPYMRWHIGIGFDTDNDQKQWQLTEKNKRECKRERGRGEQRMKEMKEINGQTFFLFVEKNESGN